MKILLLVVMLLGMQSLHPTVHVFGDSHSLVFRKLNFNVHWLGPRTMHRVGRDGINGLNVMGYGARNGDQCIFTFGEIDVRSHVLKQHKENNRSLEEVVETLMINYIKTIVENRKALPNSIFIIASITPATDVTFNPVFPYFGTLEERINISKFMNKKLREFCKRANLLFLDFSRYYATEKGDLNPELSDGNVHIGNPIYILAEYQKLFS